MFLSTLFPENKTHLLTNMNLSENIANNLLILSALIYFNLKIYEIQSTKNSKKSL